MHYEDKLNARIRETGSGLCVGLDPRPDLVEGDIEDFLHRVIHETAPLAAAYKPNIAYFEAMGAAGYQLLERVLEEIPSSVPVVLDAKRSDIPETQRYYAKAYFENWNVDAVTLNPYLGFDSIEPFLEYEGKGVYLLGVTSNEGASDFLLRNYEGQYLFEAVQQFRERAASLPGSVGLVTGLTNLSDEVLERLIDLPLLLPGLGAQGGDLGRLKAQNRKAPLLINVSRGILYRDPEKTYEQKAADYAEQIRNALA